MHHKYKLKWELWIVIWLIPVTTGMLVMISYSNTCGAVGTPPSEWPEDCAIQRDADRNTLLMFVHPRCPCSRASVQELARIMAQTGDRAAAFVLFFQPKDKPDNWSHTDLWEDATRIPEVKVISDYGAETATQFAAKTSGQLMLYDAAGRLLFAGGITAGRGHEGDNTGSSSVISLVRGFGQTLSSCPVFGCPIAESN